MKYKGIEIIQFKNNNLLLKLPNGGRSIIGCEKFLNDKELMAIVDKFLKNNSYAV